MAGTVCLLLRDSLCALVPVDHHGHHNPRLTATTPGSLSGTMGRALLPAAEHPPPLLPPRAFVSEHCRSRPSPVCIGLLHKHLDPNAGHCGPLLRVGMLPRSDLCLTLTCPTLRAAAGVAARRTACPSSPCARYPQRPHPLAAARTTVGPLQMPMHCRPPPPPPLAGGPGLTWSAAPP